jgi:quercetin dioxygenase-like cupin family protein
MRNTKIKSVVPIQWGRFLGSSLLFDNPGRSLAEENGLQYIHCDLQDPALELYRALAEVPLRLAGELAPFQFCPLPPTTYHVTAMDGINEANLDQLAQPARGEAEAFLAGLPDSACSPAPEWFPPPVLPIGQPWTLRLRFQRLAVRTQSADMVALLVPADAESEKWMAVIRDVRSEQEKPMVERGKTPTAWAPHCSLGYFPTSELAEAARQHLETWNETASGLAAGRVFQSSSLALNSFENMTKFLRHRLPAMVVHRKTIDAAIAAESAPIGTYGDQKLALTALLPANERLGSVCFKELAPSGKRHHMITCGFEAAVFDGRAGQGSHRHRAGTEVYTSLAGALELEAEGTEFRLGPGDSAIVFPGAAHNVRSGGDFLARVITLNCGGAADRFPAETEPSGGCTPEHALIVRAADLRSGSGRENLSLGTAGDLRAIDHRSAPDGAYFRTAATEFFWVVDGLMTLEIDGETHRLAEGDFAIVNPRAVRAVKSSTPFLAQLLSFGGSGADDTCPADFSTFDSTVQQHSGFWKRPAAEVNAGLEEMRLAQGQARPGVTLATATLPASVLARIAEARRIVDGMLAPHVKVKWRENDEAFHITVWGVVKPRDWADGRWPLPAESVDGIRGTMAGNLPLRFLLQGMGITGSGSVCVRVARSRALDRIRDGIEKLPLVSGRGEGEDFAYVVLGRIEPGIAGADRELLGRCMKAMEQFRIGDVTVERLQLVHYRNEFLNDVAERVLL